MLLYDKKRELLLRLIPEKDDTSIQCLELMDKESEQKQEGALFCDLTKDYS